MTTLIVVRHGQSISNLNGTFTGHMDSPLTELGLKQAERTAEYLKDRHIDAIYSSDLIRAMQTAEPVARTHGLTVIPERRLREICGGDWEGRNGAEIGKLYPENYEIWKTDVYRSTPDGGESFVEVAQRVNAFLKEILQKHRGECVAIFSHALAVRALACDWFGLPLSKVSEVPFSANASVTTVRYHDDGGIELLQYGYCDHQGDQVTRLSKGLA
ncbi:MAG: histidine phosphatase family protein [Clostridia bacterium]|nr:histidine phosphatase family protein [Clostridia bacterium]